MKIVYQGRIKTGKDIIIRYPDPSDLKEMLRYINELSDEKTFIRNQGEHETLKSEAIYLKTIIENIKNNRAVHLLSFNNSKLIAVSGITMRDKTEKHLGVFGISVAKDFRGEGLGKFLMELVLNEAKKEIPSLKIVALDVYSNNLIAQELYKKLGFIEYGRLPNGIMREGKFEDAILMYKNIR